jgi:hypothetical protein
MFFLDHIDQSRELAVGMIAAIGDNRRTQPAQLPEIIIPDFCHSHIVLIMQAGQKRLHDPAFVLERSGRRDIQRQLYRSDYHTYNFRDVSTTS